MTILSVVLCKDGVEVTWVLCNRPGTTLESKELLALIDRNTDAATRLVAHAHLMRSQVQSLYATSKAVTKLGLRRRMTGKRILQSGLFDFCRGLGEKKLIAIFSNPETRASKRELLKRLLSST